MKFTLSRNLVNILNLAGLISSQHHITTQNRLLDPYSDSAFNNNRVTKISVSASKDGQWSEWNVWSKCDTKSCVKNRKRTCKSQKGHKIRPKYCSGGNNASKESSVCSNTCGDTDWNSWSTCSSTCGRGQQLRSRGLQNTVRNQTRTCDYGPCKKINSSFPSPEGSMSSLISGRSRTTGQNKEQTRTSYWKPHIQSENQKIWPIWTWSKRDTPRKGRWTPWEEWGECSNTCAEANGARQRIRRCVTGRRQLVGIENCIGKKDRNGDTGDTQVEACKGAASCLEIWSKDIEELPRATVAINRNMKLESRSKSQGKGKKSKKERQENRKLRKSTKQQDFNELQIEWS